jgi:hypothetical protein
MGEEEPADAVEFELDGELIGRTPLGVPRPDLADAFDQPHATRAGFRTIVNVAGAADSEFELELFAVMPSGARLRFGKLCLRS